MTEILPIKEQIHWIQIWGVTESVILRELFQDYAWVEQIIRFREDVCIRLHELLMSGNVHLFNTVDLVNKSLLDRYSQWEQARWLIASINDAGSILQESLKVVQVLHMRNIMVTDINPQWLLDKSIPQVWSTNNLLEWLGIVFYWNTTRLEEDSLLFRNISL